MQDGLISITFTVETDKKVEDLVTIINNSLTDQRIFILNIDKEENDEWSIYLAVSSKYDKHTSHLRDKLETALLRE